MTDEKPTSSKDDEGKPQFGTGPVSVPVRLDLTEANRQIEEMSTKIKDSFTRSMQMDPSGFRAKEGDFSESTKDDKSTQKYDKMALDMASLIVLVRQIKDTLDTMNTNIQQMANN